jgi:hypothetical protein
MLSIETRINDDLIIYVHVHNELSLNEKGETLYEVNYYEFESSRIKTTLNFSIFHKSEEGAVKLTQLVYEQLGKRLKKPENPKGQ